MIVPQFWAEGRIQKRQEGKQVTVRRFGWSDTSQADAQQHADARAEEAFLRVWAGEKLPPRDPKTPYNGADGIPIREEIVDRLNETIITRNSYGARCLNTPDVFFADIDFEDEKTQNRVDIIATIAFPAAGVALGLSMGSQLMTALLPLAACLLGRPVVRAIHRSILKSQGGPEIIAKRRITRFLSENPTWNLRIYRTPAGLRVMATHQKFSPSAPEVSDCFKALNTDPIYRRMCLNQQCFRARVSPKPWRIGLEKRIRPNPGVWPVNPEKMPLRNAWVANYEMASQGFSSCKLIECAGSGVIHPEIRPVMELHDELCRASSSLPFA